MTLRDLLSVAFHDRWRIAAALFAGLLLTALVAAMVPKKYTAEASLLLRLGREYLYTPEVGDPNAAQAVPYDREQTMLAEAKILTSHDVVEGVVKTLGAARIYPALSAQTASPLQRTSRAVATLQKALDAELLKGSNLLQVSFKHDNAETSAQVFSSTSNGGAEADVLTRREQMTALEARLTQFKSERGIRSFAEEQTLLLAQRNAIEQRQSDVGLALAQAGGRTQSLNRQLSGIPAEIKLSTETQRGEAAENARKVLLDLKLKEREAGNKFFDGEPAVQDARANVQRAGEHLRELEAEPPRTTRTGRSAVRDGTESDLVRSTADLLQSKAGSAALAAQRSAINARLAELATSEVELRTLERERRLAETQYEAATKRLRDERVSADLDRQRKSNVSVVQRPIVPTEARSLVPVVVVVGGLLSLCAALLVGFLSALWRDTFITPSEVQRGLGVPLLASVPRVKA